MLFSGVAQLAEQENHNLCVGGSTPSAAMQFMLSVKEYLKEAANFNKRIEVIADFLNNASLRLNELVKLLEKIFDALRRGNNLVGFLKNYAEAFKNQLVSLGEELNRIKDHLVLYQRQLRAVESIIKQIRHTTQIVEENAHSFVALARTVSYLAENIEVKAYQARQEGRGLGVISRETYSVALTFQNLFQELDKFLEVIKKHIEPFLSEVGQILQEAETSVGEVVSLMSSLEALSESLAALQRFINSTERGSSILFQLEKKINERLVWIQKQFNGALRMVDEISIRGSEVGSLSQILYELNNIINRPSCFQPGVEEVGHFTYLLQENINLLRRIKPAQQPVLLSSEVRAELIMIINQVRELYNLIAANRKEIEKISLMTQKVAEIQLDLNQIVSHRHRAFEKIEELKRILKEQLQFMEHHLATNTNLITKLKTLAVFARLEKSHCLEHEGLLAPIVGEFNNLLNRMVRYFNTLDSGVSELRYIINRLETFGWIDGFIQITTPDFSRIKIFFDDTVRVFEDCLNYAGAIKTTMEKLDNDNFLLRHHWDVYQESVTSLVNFQSVLAQLLPQKAPAVVVHRAEKRLKLNLSNDPVTLKPDLKTDVPSQQVIVNYSAGLFQFGLGTGVIPGLCDEYILSEDGREYIFHIREGLKYANGKRISIEDIKLGIIRGLDGPNHNLLEMIAGSKEYLQNREEKALQIKILDAQRLGITLEYPYLPFIASFAANLADPYLDDELPVGAGPFRLHLWERGKRLILEANDFYYEGRPSLDILEFVITVDDELGYELFKSGELAIYQPGQRLLHKVRSEFPDLLVTYPELSIQFLCFHCQRPPFNNKLVRQAIAHAIDVEKLVAELLPGLAIPARGIFPPSSPMYNRRLSGYRYDPGMGRELLARAGFSTGLPDVYPLLVSDTTPSLKRAEFIKSSLGEIGIRVEINPMPWHDFLENCYRGNFHLCLQGWVSDTGDPDNFLYPLFHSNSFGYAGNTFFFSHPEIDRMIEQARQIRNIKQRLKYYQEIEERILEEAPGVFLFHGLKNIVVRKEVRGFKPHPLGIIRAKYLRLASTLENKRISENYFNTPRLLTV